jgi:hypothetical protein
MNAEWHGANPMPEDPTVEQRIRWHRAHQKYCACRPIPLRLLALMDRVEVKAPSRAPARARHRSATR